MKVSILDSIYFCEGDLLEIGRFAEVSLVSAGTDNNTLLKSYQEADILVTISPLKYEFLEYARNLKLICIGSTGYDWVDLSYLKSHRIQLCNTPSYSTNAVAEFTIGLMLAAVRRLKVIQRDIDLGLWEKIGYEPYLGSELSGKTLGIVGMGNIGSKVAMIAKHGFGMKIIGINSKNLDTLPNLLRESDIISLHVPLTDETFHMIGESQFAQMKRGVVLVNTARGDIVDETALIENLLSGHVAAAGLDVISKAVFSLNHPLLSIPQVVLTSHVGFNTEESLIRRSNILTENIIKFVQGKPQNTIV